MSGSDRHTLDATPGCRPEERPELDPERVCRAARAALNDNTTVTPHKDDEGAFSVQSFTDDHHYSVRLRPVYDCDCIDAYQRGVVCKHICLALIFTGDDEARRKAKWVDFYS